MVKTTKVVVNETALEEWRTHNPFQRASPELIKRVNKELLLLKRIVKQPAPF